MFHSCVDLSGKFMCSQSGRNGSALYKLLNLLLVVISFSGDSSKAEHSSASGSARCADWHCPVCAPAVCRHQRRHVLLYTGFQGGKFFVHSDVLSSITWSTLPVCKPAKPANLLSVPPCQLTGNSNIKVIVIQMYDRGCMGFQAIQLGIQVVITRKARSCHN